MPDLLIPKWLKRARNPVSIVFYYSRQLNRILVGFPEQFSAPSGFEKIVCTTAAEVDLWSNRLRRQEKLDEEMNDEQREKTEGAIRDYARKELISRMMNSTNQLNRDFCRFSLKRLDEQENKNKIKRISYMHCEASEKGK